MYMKKLLSIILCLTVIIGVSTGLCDTYEVFVFCNPKTPVNVRRSPKKGAKETGRLDFGDSVMTDGKTRNGFLHVLDITEDGEGWIFAGYVVNDEPEVLDNAWAYIGATGRVISYRWIDGMKNGWVRVCEQVRVYAISDEWAYTSKGYIRTKYLEVWYE